MASSNFQTALNSLLQKAKKQNYLLYDDIFETSSQFNLEIQEIDKLSSAILENSILLYEQKPQVLQTISTTEDEFENWAHNDYEPIFKEVIEREPCQEDFINSIRKIVPPQRREIQTLQYQLLEGNKHARKRVIEMHLRLAVKLALQFSKDYEQDLNDMISCACEGLILAADGFNPDENGKFSGYASLWIMQVMQRNFLTKKTLIYYPSHFIKLYMQIIHYYEESKLPMQDGKIKRKLIKTIENQFSCSSQEAVKLSRAFIPVENIDNVFENDNTEVEEHIEKWNFQRYDLINEKEEIAKETDQFFLQNRIISVFNTLPPREQKVLTMRYGLYFIWNKHGQLLETSNKLLLPLYTKENTSDDNKLDKYEKEKLPLKDYIESHIVSGDELTLEDIGNYYGVTRERIRQIEAKALKRLRHSRRANGLRVYIE